MLGSLADDILALAGGRLLIAIDGVDGSGKTAFARELAAALSGTCVIVIHVDDFLNLREVRHRRGRDSAEGFWLDSYDYDALRRDVLAPLGTGGSGAYRTAASDHRYDTAVSPPLQSAPENCVVIVEGMFLHRDELVDVWDYSLFLDVPFSETARRMAVRDGSNPDPEHPSMKRYVGGQRLYFAGAQPWTRATRLVDNTNPLEPRILAAGTRAGD
ncbi:uridine kinase [Salinibacterium sp. UTAS2018]|nr:uridine kinase [Salinibacterium sp. UTAS2018]